METICKLEVFRTLKRDLLRNTSDNPKPPTGSTNSELRRSEVTSPNPPITEATVRNQGHRTDVSVDILLRNLGSSQGADRYYALRQGVDKLGLTVKLSVDDTMNLLSGIRDPGLQYNSMQQWLLPKLATPVPPADALRLVSGFPSFERTRILQTIQACITRPIRYDAAQNLLVGITGDARSSLSAELDGQPACFTGRTSPN